MTHDGHSFGFGRVADRYDGRKLTPMAFVERLEEMEGRGAFPSDWLYSSGIDDLAFSD